MRTYPRHGMTTNATTILSTTSSLTQTIFLFNINININIYIYIYNTQMHTLPYAPTPHPSSLTTLHHTYNNILNLTTYTIHHIRNNNHPLFYHPLTLTIHQSLHTYTFQPPPKSLQYSQHNGHSYYYQTHL